MTTKKTLNIRMQSKKDTLVNWTSNNPILLEGEVAYVVIPAESGAVAQEPIVLTKVGDGTTAFNALSYVGALAADVYSWAKTENKPQYSAKEIDGLEDYAVSYQVVKVDDQNYKLQSKTGDGDWIDVDDSTIRIPDFDISNLEKQVEANTEAIETLNGTGEGSVVKITAETVAEILADAEDKLEKLKELADFLVSDETGAAGLVNDVEQLKELVGDTSVAEQIADAIKDALCGCGSGESSEGGTEEDSSTSDFKFALASELEALAEKVEALEDIEVNIDDLVQTEDTYVVFNCGSSTEVI